MNSILKKPSAWIPIALSSAWIVAWCIALATSGAPMHQPDEGTAAHLFQIWLFLEVFMICFFAVKWLPQKPKDTLFVLAIQIVAVLIVCAPVFYFKL